MRLQHLKQISDGLAARDPAARSREGGDCSRGRAIALAGSGMEKAKNARKSTDRTRAVMHHFRGERDSRNSVAPSRKLWTALRALDKYLTGQSAWLASTMAERHRAGLRVGTATHRRNSQFPGEPPDEQKSANALAWHGAAPTYCSRFGAQSIMGTFGSEFGQKFHPANDSCPPAAIAA